jgi:hypothetical protein
VLVVQANINEETIQDAMVGICSVHFCILEVRGEEPES